MAKVYGIVRLTKADGTVEEHKNSIVNLSLLLNQLVNLTTTPSSTVSPYIIAGGITVSVSMSIKQQSYQWVFTYVAKPKTSLSFTVASLYPTPLSLMTDTPLAILNLSSEATDITTICWSIYIADSTGIIPNSLPSKIITSAPFSLRMYADDGYAVSLMSLYNYNRYVYNFYDDSTTGNKISYVNASWLFFLDYTTAPTTVQTSNVRGIQVVPNSGSQHSVFYYLGKSSYVSSGGYNLLFQMHFTFTQSSTNPADGFVVCLFASSPPVTLNTASVSGMANSTVAVGEGNMVCVEFDPYASQPISIVTWEGGYYYATLVSAGSTSSHTSMTPCHDYYIIIKCSNGTLTVCVSDCTTNTLIAKQSAIIATNFLSNCGYVIITFRTGSCYANWTITNLITWYPYSVQLSVDYTSPQIMPITAVFNSD